MAGTVISFGFTPAEQKKLKTVCDKVGVRLKKVTPMEYGQPIGSFVGLAEKGETTGTELPLDGQMLVFASVSDRQLDAILSGLRTVRVGIGSFKAMVTPTNASWTAYALLEELKKEREELGDIPQ